MATGEKALVNARHYKLQRIESIEENNGQIIEATVFLIKTADNNITNVILSKAHLMKFSNAQECIDVYKKKQASKAQSSGKGGKAKGRNNEKDKEDLSEKEVRETFRVTPHPINQSNGKHRGIWRKILTPLFRPKS